MKAYIFLLTLLILLFSSNLYAGDKVYSNDDLDQYKYGEEDKTYQYNQNVLQYNQNKSDQYDTQTKFKNILDAQKREIEDQRIRKDKALNRIKELEQERAHDKTERDFIGGYVGKRNAEERRKRAVQREAEIDNAYREAGLSKERELQKRASEAESELSAAEGRASAAEGRASAAEGRARDAESDASAAESRARQAEWAASDAESKARDAEQKERFRNIYGR